MSDTVFYNKVKTLLDQLDILFHQEWDETLGHLDKSTVEKFVDRDGTFLEPEGEGSQEDWKSRDRFLNAYRGAVVAMMRIERGVTSSQQVQPQAAETKPSRVEDTSAPVSVYPASSLLDDKTATNNPSKAPLDMPEVIAKKAEVRAIEPLSSSKPASFTEAVKGKASIVKDDGKVAGGDEDAEETLGLIEPRAKAISEEVVESTSVDSKEVSLDVPTIPANPPKMPKMPSMGMPKPISGPQGFPSPFSKPVSLTPNDVSEKPKVQKLEETKGGESSRLDPSTGKVVFTTDNKVDDEAEIRKKFGYLLEGVKQEKIRDFILADGINTKTGKPSMIIYTPAGIWLEFAFDFDEGKRILDKYPQRDPELIEFMKSTGHLK